MIKKIVLLLLLVGMATTLNAAVLEGSGNGGGWRFHKPAALPNTQLRVHDVGKVWMSVTNFGFFGSQDGVYEDYSGKYLLAPGFEYPGGTNLQYLFQGALWIGALVDTVNNLGQPALDTLVSIGNDGWWGQLFEMFPDIPPGGAIKVRSTRPTETYPYGDTAGAKSEQDYVAVYTDTFTTSVFVNPDANDGRPHMPLHISITERSYAWSYEYAEDFILFDFDIQNISHTDTLKNVWVGMYIDADVYHTSENPYGIEQGAQDDICGFDSIYVTIDGNDTSISRINTAWIADNDGQSYDGAYDFRSPRGVSGVRVVRTPLADSLLRTGFNWWISNTDADQDWGPRRTAFGSDRFPGGGYGTPGGDKAKYQVMSNHEFDYDQIWCANTFDGWLAPPSSAPTLANGYDTRYLFSFGPFLRVYPGDTLKLTTAYIGGEEFHSDPSNYTSNLKTHETDTTSIRAYYNNLSFQDFATNSQWADWVYDNPGVDTDPDGDGPLPPDGYRGDLGTHYRINASEDTIWFKGDGVPDFAGPPPPPAPLLTVIPSKNKVRLEWDGKATEHTEDSFLKKIDFEGYRIYKSATGRSDDYSVLADFDIIDFDLTWWDETVTPNQWKKWNKPPRRIEEFPEGFNPAVVRPEDVNFDTALTLLPQVHFVPYGWNRGFGNIILDADSFTYAYELGNLSETQGLYFAVTAYDFGNPVTKLSSLESAPSINAKLAYPIEAAGGDIKVAVYPNPYIITNSTRRGGYLDMGWEDRDGSGNTQFDRRIIFAGLPDNFDIKIFTIDGDLVKEIMEGDAYYQITPGVAFWDLISRNTQAVVSGVYIYSIDGDNGYHELGKLAIIK